jgi:hypothetical protein
MSEWQQGASWPSNNPPSEVEVVAQPELQLTEAQKDEIVRKWLAEKEVCKLATEAEKVSRESVTKALFPNPKKGTQRYVHPQGYGSIKLVYGWNYNLGDREKVDPSTQLKVPVSAQVDAVLERIEGLGERGRVMAERLVRWKPELVTAEYEQLAASDDDVDIQIKGLIDDILTVTPASPQLTFEPPKEKK